MVIKDRHNLPFIPGKTLKGLIREAVEEIALLSNNNTKEYIEDINKTFGYLNEEENQAIHGEAFFTNATLPKTLHDAIYDHQLSSFLYRTIASTKIDDQGIAEDHSLRRLQTTIPCELEGDIFDVPENMALQITNALLFIKRLGQNRNRGLGRCSIKVVSSSESTNVEIEKQETKNTNQETKSANQTLTFECTLLTDLIINQRAATEGNQNTLDFIPGSNFLGITARAYKNFIDSDALTVFHSGKVRFGDAHPHQANKRSLRIPASFYEPKLKPEPGETDKGLYIHHEVTNTDEIEYKAFQAKQCRSGFYVFEENKLTELKSNKSFAIKSAHDRTKRRSEDEKMYGYESLAEGSLYQFEVTFDSTISTELMNQVKENLIGQKRIGRSRTAQYGLVKITAIEPVQHIKYSLPKTDIVLVYADARLIFLDEYGLPTFQPTVQQLGFKNGTICWSKSQIRTFQYAPFNSIRQARDTDRCGIEKGSVFFISTEDKHPNENWVGNYQNEGFGKIIMNPEFLEAEPGTNGKAKYTINKEKKQREKTNVDQLDHTLFQYLKKQSELKQQELKVYKLVNKFIHDHKSKFEGDKFASQWGSIRSLAIQNKDSSIRRKAITEFITHGVSENKWEEKGRFEALITFLTSLEKTFEQNTPAQLKLNNEFAQLALINLSAEMAKNK